MDWFLNIACLILIYRVTLIKAIAKPYNVTDYDWVVWCKLQANGYNCLEKGISSKFYYDVKLQGCKAGEFGECMHNLNSFSTLTTCRETCGDHGQHEITANISAKVYCRLQPDFGDCHNYHPMFYYDLTFRRCKGFSYSGCGGNLNRFPNREKCSSTCFPVIEYMNPKYLDFCFFTEFL